MKLILTITLLSIASLIYLTACEPRYDTTEASPMRFQTKCMEGVQYYILGERGSGNQGYGYMSVKFNRDGTVATC